VNLASAFVASAQKFAPKSAVFWGDREFSYEYLLTQTLQVAARLRDVFLVKPGDRVGLWLRNCPEFVTAFFGILQAGAAVVPINNFLKPDEVSYILNHAGIDLLITDAGMAELLPKLLAARPQLKCWPVEEFARLAGLAADLKAEPFPARREQDLAAIIYTSGTTGHPKGAMLSHGNLLHNVESCRQILAVVDVDRFVVLLPMFHSFMLTVGVLLPLLVGGSLIVIKSLHPPKNILQEIYQWQGTILACIPQFFRTLAHAHLPGRLPLRLCISGGAPLPKEILREFNAKMPIPLLEGYGLSEASPVVSVNPVKGPWKEGSIGVPIAGVEVTVQDEEGTLLPPGQTGEICVRGGNVMLGYWNQPEETARAIRRGWLLTGDIGHQDNDGYFYVTDRKKDMLIVNGINVYPREIEEVIYQFNGVKEAAVIGMPDARKGEHPLAFVAPMDGVQLDEKAFLQFLRQKLADYKVPKQVIYLPALPRNATGKILKTVLRQHGQSDRSLAH
jgi:long-chain acyl-CoA synthetase